MTNPCPAATVFELQTTFTMKINSAIAAAILAFTSGAYAEEETPEKASPAAVALPTFTVSRTILFCDSVLAEPS